MDLAECGLKRSEGKMQQYKDLGCGANIPLENCMYYQYKLKQNPNDIGVQSLISNNKCDDLLKENLNEAVKGFYDTYTSIDKQRIESESKYQRNVKIFIGGMVFLTVIGIFLIRKK